jgi:hypothetical protein
MPRLKKTVSVRTEPNEHAAWVAAARSEARSLANWIARCCNAAARRKGFDPTKPSKRKKARGKPQGGDPGPTQGEGAE